MYTGESVLGTCFLFDLGRPSSIEIRQDGHDAWFVEFASVELIDGTEHSCHYDHWFDEGAKDTCVIWSQVCCSPYWPGLSQLVLGPANHKLRCLSNFSSAVLLACVFDKKNIEHNIDIFPVFNNLGG